MNIAIVGLTRQQLSPLFIEDAVRTLLPSFFGSSRTKVIADPNYRNKSTVYMIRDHQGSPVVKAASAWVSGYPDFKVVWVGAKTGDPQHINERNHKLLEQVDALFIFSDTVKTAFHSFEEVAREHDVRVFKFNAI